MKLIRPTLRIRVGARMPALSIGLGLLGLGLAVAPWPHATLCGAGTASLGLVIFAIPGYYWRPQVDPDGQA